jgi:hypothetical protein
MDMGKTPCLVGKDTNIIAQHSTAGRGESALPRPPPRQRPARSAGEQVTVTFYAPHYKPITFPPGAPQPLESRKIFCYNYSIGKDFHGTRQRLTTTGKSSSRPGRHFSGNSKHKKASSKYS